MKRRNSIVILSAAIAIVAGCATGPKYAEVTRSFPALKTEEGRVFFFRSNSMFGAAVQADIRLNGVVVGTSQPEGFFFVDRTPGSYIGASSTETEKTLSFTLTAGETRYVRTSPSFGVLIGRINLDLEDPKKAQAEIETISYTGGKGGK